MSDNVNSPKHYVSHPSGVEAIEVCEHLSFCIGNAVKYVWRAGLKTDRLEDLKKAAWYLARGVKIGDYGGPVALPMEFASAIDRVLQAENEGSLLSRVLCCFKDGRDIVAVRVATECVAREIEAQTK